MPNWNTVIRMLESDEPDYAEIAALITPSALNRLRELVRTGEPLIASKATHLASLVPAPEMMLVIADAANRKEPMVRVAAAAAIGAAQQQIRSLQADEADVIDSHTETLERLLHDPDPGVRKRANRSQRTLLDGPIIQSGEGLVR